MSSLTNKNKSLLQRTVLFTRIAQSLQNATLEDVRAVASRLLDRVNAFCLLPDIDKKINDIFRSFQYSLTKTFSSNDFWGEDVINSLKHLISISTDFSNLGPNVKVPQGEALSALSAIVEDANKLVSLVENVKKQDSNSSNNVVEPQQPQKQNNQYLSPSVIVEIQKKLNQLLVSTGKIVPLDPDGKLGNATQRALNVFKREYNLPAGISQQELFKKVYTATELESGSRPQARIDSDNPVFNTLNQNGPKV